MNKKEFTKRILEPLGEAVVERSLEHTLAWLARQRGRESQAAPRGSRLKGLEAGSERTSTAIPEDVSPLLESPPKAQNKETLAPKQAFTLYYMPTMAKDTAKAKDASWQQPYSETKLPEDELLDVQIKVGDSTYNIRTRHEVEVNSFVRSVVASRSEKSGRIKLDDNSLTRRIR